MTLEEIDIWEDDLLGRKQDAEFLYNFLNGQVEKRKSQGRIGSYVINIDSDWGGGKTFFLERFAKDIAGRGHMVVEINAWRDDYAEDPYIAIMAAIDRAFAPTRREMPKLRPLGIPQRKAVVPLPFAWVVRSSKAWQERPSA